MAGWLQILMAPGSSLGGARPKAGVSDQAGHLWIAKFPSKADDRDIGGWEQVVQRLAIRAGLGMAKGEARRFSHRYHTFLTKRFDREGPARIHFASAMTLLGPTDGPGARSGISYLQLAEFIMQHGARPNNDLEELWRRIVFSISVHNSDDHLRNQGFLLTARGWVLSPAFELNPTPHATGLSLNINENSNALDLDLAREVAERFRINEKSRESIIRKVLSAVGNWKDIAGQIGINRSEIHQMEDCFP
jgi:serine/threonine-protein kinase HipA